MKPAVSVVAALVGLGAALGAVSSSAAADFTRQVAGVLEEVDFIHRTGRFRTCPAGERIEVVLTPDAVIECLNADADLRHLPLGTVFDLTLHRDSDGRFTRATVVRDRFTADARAGITYRVEEANLETGALRLISLLRSDSGRKEPQAAGRSELRTSAQTQIWHGDRKVTLAAIRAGDEILANRGGDDAAPCVEIWIGRATHAAVTNRQRQRYAVFLEARGLPARVERTEGRTLTLSVFGGEPATAEKTWPGDSSQPGHPVRVAVANDELRTWNPPVDHEWGKIVAFRKGPPGHPRGVRLVVTVNHMLEGFRRGRYVRVFPDAWQLKDQPFGEQLFHYGARAFPPELAECPAKEYPEQFPFRTDYANAHLPWYRVQPGLVPPPDSEHRAFAELLAVGADHRSARFRLDNTAEEVELRFLPRASIRFLNAAVDLADAPVGTRYLLHLYQDDSGAFRQVSFMTDEVSDLVQNGAVWRIASLNREAGTLTAARQPPAIRNDQGDPEQPPDIGRALLRIDPSTRVWKRDRSVGLAALSVGDLLLVDRTGDRPRRPSRCTDVWVGPDTHKQLTTLRPRKSSSSVPKGAPR